MLASDGVAFFLGLPISGASSFWWEGKSRVGGELRESRFERYEEGWWRGALRLYGHHQGVKK